MSADASWECFRVFLILPEFELFSYPQQFCDLIGQLAIAFLNLDKKHKLLIGMLSDRQPLVKMLVSLERLTGMLATASSWLMQSDR
jgi:hypothetical protein